MNVTDELRRLLDERGVRWDELVGHPVVIGTEWHDRDGFPCTALEHADDVPDGMLSVQANLTPEQAVEATLGRETCEADETDTWECVRDDLGSYGKTLTVHVMECTECGHTYEHVNGSYEFCPRCGRKVVGT